MNTTKMSRGNQKTILIRSINPTGAFVNPKDKTTKFIVTIKRYFGNILSAYPKLVISRPKVNLGKVSSTFELIKEIINTRERILLLYGDIIELEITN